MEQRHFLLGMGQISVHGGELEKNLNHAEEIIIQAAQQGCKIIVLPECLDLGWTHPSARELAQPIPGPTTIKLTKIARLYQIYIVAGLTEKATEGIFNAAVFISPEGNILLKHRKINELDIAHDLYSAGTSLEVVNTPLGVIGINICADNFPNSLVLGHSLARIGAQMILSPCAWAMPADHNNKKHPYGKMWEKSYSTLARLYNIYMVGVSNVGEINGGPWKGRNCIGNSLTIGPDGKILMKGSYGVNSEQLLTVPIQIGSPLPWGTKLIDYLHSKRYRGP